MLAGAFGSTECRIFIKPFWLMAEMDFTSPSSNLAIDWITALMT